ncbi:MAG: alkaline phosphatase family protein, partial [Anaerolineales bacterium]
MNKLKRLTIRAGAVLLIALMTMALLSALPAMRASAATSVVLKPVADAYINAAFPTTNFGKLTSLRADASPVVVSLVRFNVGNLGGLPIVQARLRIYANSGSTFGISVKSVASNIWGESLVTARNMPALGNRLSGVAPVVAKTWVTLNVSSYVRAAGIYSFALTTPGGTAISLASRESGANAPRLVLIVGSTATATSTLAAATSTEPAATPTDGPTPASTDTPDAFTPTAGPTNTPTATPVSHTTGAIQHVFVVVMENHSYKEVWNTGSSPYITQLGNSFARASNYKATDHPSLPNYLQLYAGSNYGINTDCSPSSSCHVNARSLADNLEAKGLTWKAYMESMPSPCYITSSGGYAPKHNPFVYFDDIRNDTTRCATHVVPFTAFSADLSTAATTPNFVFISPNQCNDMHDCSVSTGDNWLKSHIAAMLNSPSCTADTCLVVVTWDEDDGSQANQVLTIFAGSGAKTGGVISSASYTHYSLLHTIENIFGVPTQTAQDAGAS